MIIPELNMIKWRCRRGMLEIDILLNSFIDNKINNLSEKQINDLQDLLLEDDPCLEKWLIKEPNSVLKKYQEICKMIIQNAQEC